MKWPRAAGKSRAGNADALASVTPALFLTAKGLPELKTLRRALTGWAFNVKHRDDPKPPEIARALKGMSSNTFPVSRLADSAKLREALDQKSLKTDGKQAAAKTVKRKRAVFYSALEYAVELKALTVNRIGEVKWDALKVVRSIDRRVVVNNGQAKSLLDAVAAQYVDGQPRRSAGPMLKAYFAVMYYAALRPEEAVNLSKADLSLPEKGWGELLISQTAPIAGAAWTDTGKRRDSRQLKQRGVGEVRPVPSNPALTRLRTSTWRSSAQRPMGGCSATSLGRGVRIDGRPRLGQGPKAALTDEEYVSPLARRPYDLRHACVSTWLAGGVQSAQCAEWADHSVAVLHQIYAKVIAGLESQARERIERVLDLDEESKS